MDENERAERVEGDVDRGELLDRLAIAQGEQDGKGDPSAAPEMPPAIPVECEVLTIDEEQVLKRLAIAASPESSWLVGLEDLTYSRERTFASCRRKYFLRYVEGLRSRGPRDLPLWQGGLFHDAKEVFYRLVETRRSTDPFSAWTAARSFVASKLPNRFSDANERLLWLNVVEMLRGYLNRWRGPRSGDLDGSGVRDRALSFIAIEQRGHFPIRNPATGSKSRTFRGSMKIDGLVRRLEDRRLYLLESKTAAAIDQAYIDQLWTDAQIRRYARALGELLGEPIVGAIYDVSVKTRIRPRLPYKEPEADWRARVEEKVVESLGKLRERMTTRKKDPREPNAEDIAADRARVEGLVSMRRKIIEPETNEEFRARLQAHYEQPDSFERLVVIFNDADLAEIEEDTWETTKQLIDARYRGVWQRNRAACFNYGRACQFLLLCKSRIDNVGGDLSSIALEDGEPIANFFERVEPDEELRDSAEDWLDEVGDDAFIEPEERPFEGLDFGSNDAGTELATGLDVSDVIF